MKVLIRNRLRPTTHSIDTSDTELLYDFRRDKALNVIWDMRYQIGSGNTLHLSWDIEATSLEGNLTLNNDDDSINVDMTSESSVDIPASGSGSLIIEYEVENYVYSLPKYYFRI